MMFSLGLFICLYSGNVVSSILSSVSQACLPGEEIRNNNKNLLIENQLPNLMIYWSREQDIGQHDELFDPEPPTHRASAKNTNLF